MDSFWLCIIIGLVCGIFSALFGVGSGVIMVPALVLISSLSQKSAQGVALAIMVPMALTGAIRYKMNPDIEMDMKIIALLAAGGVAGALIGTWLVPKIHGMALRRIFAIIMLITAVKMFFTPEKKTETLAPSAEPPVPGAPASDSTRNPSSP